MFVSIAPQKAQVLFHDFAWRSAVSLSLKVTNDIFLFQGIRQNISQELLFARILVPVERGLAGKCFSNAAFSVRNLVVVRNALLAVFSPGGVEFDMQSFPT